MTYTDYIGELIAQKYDGEAWRTRGNCGDEAHAMARRFPEPRVVSGHVHPGRRSHFWCVTLEGDIVDPTAGQFGFIERYEEWHDGDEVQIGRCMHCAAAIWGRIDEGRSRDFCSRECNIAWAEVMDAGRTGV